MKMGVGQESGTHKHTHGQGKLYALPPFYGGGIVIICIKFFSNLTVHDKNVILTKTSFNEAYAQSLRANCDLDV